MRVGCSGMREQCSQVLLPDLLLQGAQPLDDLQAGRTRRTAWSEIDVQDRKPGYELVCPANVIPATLLPRQGLTPPLPSAKHC